MLTSSPTLFKYMSSKFLSTLLVFMLILTGVIFVIDIIELLRRVSDGADVPFSMLMSISMFKMPYMVETTMPIGILFSSMYTCWKLNETSELIVMRAAGLSAWQFLTPLVFSALFVGVITTTILNPISSVFYERYEQLDKIHIKGDTSIASISKAGVWLRQPTALGYALINASKIESKEWNMSEIIAIFFDKEDNFVKRVDAKSARLIDGFWRLENSTVNNRYSKKDDVDFVNIPTELTVSKIEESFASPETVPFWGIPQYIKIMKDTGLSTTSMQLHFQKLLSRPIMFIGIILLTAIFSLRPTRMGNTAYLIVSGIAIGFGLFFMESFLEAFGMSHKIPVIFAAWCPAIISLLMGITLILHLEDG